MITRNLWMPAALAVAALHSTSTEMFVNSFSVTTRCRNRQFQSGWTTTTSGPPSATIEFGTPSTTVTPTTGKETATATTTTTALSMGGGGGVRSRGLEKRREGPTPTVGGMVLYLKAAEDGTSVGDCPFAHYIRLILEEKGLPYTVVPCSGDEDKPEWLLDYYEGKLPCLKHNKEAYVESNVIAAYLDYFFQSSETKTATPESKASLKDAEVALNGFFPAVAGYLKDVEGDDDDDSESLANLRESLTSLEGHLASSSDGNGYLDGSSSSFTVPDCRLVPQLYHLQVGIEKFKTGRPSLETEFPKIHGYLQRSMERPSFQATQYSPETIEWGWTNARQ